MKLFRKILAVLLAVFTVGAFASCSSDVYTNAQSKFEKKDYLWTEVTVSDATKENGILNVAYAFSDANEGMATLGKLAALSKANEKGKIIIIMNCSEEKIEDVKTNGMDAVKAELAEDQVASALLGYLSSTATTNGNCVAFGGDAAIELFSKC